MIATRNHPHRNGTITRPDPTWAEVAAAIGSVLAAGPAATKGPDEPRTGRLDVFADRLLGLRHAEALADGLGEVRVAVGTVITPLARDLLRRRGIGVRVVSAVDVARASRVGEWGFAIASRTGLAGALRRALLAGWSEVGGDAVEAAAWVLQGDGRGAFVVADEGSVAAWRANRLDPAIRAAGVDSPDGAARAVRSLGANVVVAEPHGRSLFLLKEIGMTFRRGGAPEVPPDLEVPR